MGKTLESSILDTALDPTIVINKKNIVKYFNLAASKMFLINPNDIIGKSVTMIMTPTDAVKHSKGLNNYIETNIKKVIEKSVIVTAKKGNGDLFKISLFVSEIDNVPDVVNEDDSRLFVAIIKDVTETIYMENILKTTINEAADSIFVTNEDGTIFLINKAIKNLFGYTNDELMCKNIKILIPELDYSFYEDFENKIITGLKKNNKEIKCRLGLSRIVGGKIENGKGQVSYVGILHEDYSEKIKEVSEERVKLINYIFHEVRNPINVLSTGIDLIDQKLLEIFPDMKNIKNTISLMRSSVKRASKILNDTLDYTKFEQKANVLNTEIQNLSIIVQEAIKLSKLKALEYDIMLHNDVEDDIYTDIDKNRIFQAINNLLSNALKFTPPNGKIYIETTKNSGYAHFKIKDTGCGISEIDIKKIFKPYNNITSSHNNNKIKGMGMGLSITKKIIELHSSVLSVESELGKGTIFSFKIPLVSETKLKEFKNKHENYKGEELKYTNKVEYNMKILLVDDDRSNLFVLKNLLEMRGFEVDTLSDGKELIECVKNKQNKEIKMKEYHLILLDNLMKYTNGSETLKILRNEYDFNQKVVILSGCTTKEDAQYFKDCGADGVLEKPFNYEKFLEFL